MLAHTRNYGIDINKQKHLPIEIKPLITSECWVFFKLAIIQSLPVFDSWSAGRLKIYMDFYGKAYFGENGEVYPLSYFTEILDIGEYNILKVSSDEIENLIIREIDKGNYLLVDVNLPKLYDIEESEPDLHEMLIYGYDMNSRKLLMPSLVNGVFRESEIDLDKFKLAYIDAQNHFLHDVEDSFWRRMYYFGITVLKPKTNYINCNAIYDFISKLRNELEGRTFTIQSDAVMITGDVTYTYYTGITCLLRLADAIQGGEGFREWDHEDVNYCRTCLVIYENQNIILYSLNWFLEEMGHNSEEFSKLNNAYAKCCQDMYDNVMLLYKYDMTRNEKIIDRVSKSLRSLYAREKTLLEKIIPLAIKMSAEHIRSAH